MNNKTRLKTILKFAKPYSVLFLLAEICIIVSYTVSVLLPMNVAKLVDDVFYAENQAMLKEVILTFIILFLVSIIFNLIYSYVWQALINKYIVDVKLSMYERIVYTKANILSDIDSGDIMSRIDYDADQFIYIIQRNIFHFINSIIMCIGIIYMIAVINKIIAIMLIIAAVIPIITTRLQRRYMEKYSVRLRKLNGILTGRLFDFLKGFREIKLLQAGRRTYQMLFNNIKESIHWENKTKKVDFAVNKVIYLINLTVSIVIYAYSAYLIYTDRMSIGFFLAIIEYIALLHKKINWILRIYLDWHGRKVSIDRVCEVLNYDIETEGKVDIDDIEKIVFQNTGFAYREGQYVLNNISFEINKGDKVALTGESGVGKTTLTGLILKLFDTQEGRILINGFDISEIDSFKLRSCIGVVGQDIRMFNGSIRNNLILGCKEPNDINDDTLMKLCEKVGLSDLIKSLPDGLDTVIGNNINLSGGQKQRFMIAGMLLKGTKTIILDEATSALDENTESLILDEIDRLGNDITVIIISHRESAIKNCNKIIRLGEEKVCHATCITRNTTENTY